jgi:hypothetical protein
MSLFIERIWPYGVGAIAWLVWWRILGAPFPLQPDALMGASGTVSAVLIGFMGTAKAIVLGLADSAVFRQLKEAGYMGLLFNYLYEAVLAGLALLVISIFGFFLPHDVVPTHVPGWFAGVWVFLGFTAVSLYIRALNHLFKLVRHA